jgi:hypothetical protein
VAPSDGKAVALIEKLIGQTIPWMGEPPTAADTAGRLDGPRESRGGRHGRNAPRREHSSPRRETSPRQHSPARASAPPTEQPPASVTRIEEARPRRERKPVEPARPRQEPPERDDPALSHLPAFLLRPVRVKA